MNFKNILDISILFNPVIPTYVLAYTSIQLVSDLVSKQIPFDNLESIIKEEAKKLDLKIPELEITYDSNQVKGNTFYVNPDNINISKIKHELYHIKKNDGETYSFIKYLLVEEPRATLYGCFNVKL